MRKTIHFILFIFAYGFLAHCGTGIGNGIFGDPTTPSGSAQSNPNLDFSIPIQEYADSASADCGSFTEDSTIAEVDAGRQCIHDAFDSCTESKYLYNKTNSDGSRFVSFVNILEPSSGSDCQIHIHTVSDVPPDPIGDADKTCSTLDTDELPEIACGIANTN